MILENIIYKLKKEKLFSLLIDPEKYNTNTLIKTIQIANENKVDYFFVGGSLISDKIDKTITIIKRNSSIPVLLFPGSYLQISNNADGILFNSLISGRNPDYLIGNHVVIAPLLKKSKLEVIPTGYILVNGKRITSVEYMSNTTPIPPEKLDIIIATAQAGEMLGLKLIYLEAGSGADEPVNSNIISNVKKNIELPLIVGGGLKNPKEVDTILRAGADMIVIGNAVENNIQQLISLCKTTKKIQL